MDSDSARRFRRRDYTSEPIRTNDTPIYNEESKPRRKKSKKKWFLGVFFVLLIAAVVSLWILTRDNSNYHQLRKDLTQAQKDVSFPARLLSHQ
jgi:cell division septal protein FtsQ